MVADFSSFVSATAGKEHARKQIRVRRGKRKNSFYALLWNNISVIDVGNLVFTEMSDNAPSLASLAWPASLNGARSS